MAGELRTGLATALELIKGLWDGPYWWLVPALVVLLPTALVFVVIQGMPLVAPFVYTLFEPRSRRASLRLILARAAHGPEGALRPRPGRTARAA